MGKFGKNFPNIPRFSPLFSMVCNFGAALTSFVFAGFPTFPKMGIPTQNGIYFPKWENLGIFGKTWFPVLGFFGKIWENNFLEVNLWWEILRNFGIFREIIISSFRIFVEILFWEILGNNRKNIPNGKKFSRSVDKMGNLLMRNFGKIWDYSGKQSRFGIFWEILGNEKLLMKNFWENMGLFRKKVPFWDILGNFGKWKTMVLYNRHLLISIVTTVFYLVLFVIKLGFWGSPIKQFSWLLCI